MQLLIRSIQYWFSKFLVLIMYLFFFAVQIFFNLDIGQRSLSSVSSRTYQHQTGFAKHTVDIKQLIAKLPSHTKVRLSKRFQPSSVPSLQVHFTELAFIPAKPLSTGLYKQQYFATVFRPAHSLRGPPVV